MSTEPALSPEATLLLDDAREYVEESERERRTLRGDLVNVRALLKQADEYKADMERQLAAAEKRAELAETRLARLTGVCRHGACGDPPLESGYCREHEAAFAAAPTQPQEPR